MRSRRRTPAGGVQAEKQRRYVQLIAEGLGNSEACRVVGIDRKTGNRWRYGRKVRNSAGAVVIYPRDAVVSRSMPTPAQTTMTAFICCDVDWLSHHHSGATSEHHSQPTAAPVFGRIEAGRSLLHREAGRRLLGKPAGQVGQRKSYSRDLLRETRRGGSGFEPPRLRDCG
jgi:hypothetical protein